MASRKFCLIAAAALISVAVYLAYADFLYRLGFPLDDAWIHQTYARNLVEHGQWVYSAGKVSGGSTAPLWTLMLSGAYLLDLSPKIWAYSLGCGVLIATAWVCVQWYEKQSAGNRLSGAWLALLIIFEWHLVWAALSGMETLLMGLLPVIFFLLMETDHPGFRMAGALVGLGVWIRPDAILLLIAAIWILLFRSGPDSEPSRRLTSAWQLVSGFLPFFALYLLFNQFSAGAIWPTTFFAKQAEYAVLLQTPLLGRVVNLIQAPLVGVGVLLLPAFLLRGSSLLRQRRLSQLAPFLWVVVYFSAYLLRLPVTYQHGRYLMPIIPTSIVLGYLGLDNALRMTAEKLPIRALLRAWGLAIPVITLAFWVIGARAYARDVAVIESEMVDTALWLSKNTANGAKIAAHDIGAVGYYAGRDLLDLAGLVSPDVIPIIRDEQALKDVLDKEDVDYLVTFPGWYPYLSAVGEQLFTTGARFSPEQGGENMTVYRWP
ncbi:MAG: hypothetical protein P1P76_07740 [Anaerolineales bacterium]|nr:hypothetical protein [Anaerolineales bacterium]